jgi:uncharacterized membrane-anchored protein YjiN (DUF445 family)
VAVKNATDLATFREMGREYIYVRNGKSTRIAEPERVVEGGGRAYERPAYPGANGAAPAANTAVSAFTVEELGYLRKVKPTIPEKALKQQYLELYTPKDHVSTTIRKMLSVVFTDERYQNYLPTDVVARLIRHTNLEVVRSRLIAQIEDMSPLDYVRLKEIERAKQKVLQRIRQKIQNQYVASGKIDTDKGEIYYRTLADVLEDITHSKKIESYFRHLRKYMPELTQRRYRQEERTIFEYLGKLTKKWFREYLKDLL